MQTPRLSNVHIVGTRHERGSKRFQMSPSAFVSFAFRDFSDLEAPDDEVIVSGCSEVLIQGRMCGDFYVELSGPKFCIARAGDDCAAVLRGALSQVAV